MPFLEWVESGSSDNFSSFSMWTEATSWSPDSDAAGSATPPLSSSFWYLASLYCKVVKYFVLLIQNKRKFGQHSHNAIGHVNEYPTMHYFRVPRHTRSMIAYKILTEYFWKFQWKLHCGNVVNKPCWWNTQSKSYQQCCHWLSVPGITRNMHCGILFRISYICSHFTVEFKGNFDIDRENLPEYLKQNWGWNGDT